MLWKRDKVKTARPRGVEEGAKVELTIAGQRPIDARVEEVGHCHAVLGLYREPDRPLHQLGEADGQIKTNGRSGTLKAAVRVRQHNDEPDAVRVEFTGATEIVQRRGHFRMDLMTPVTVSRSTGAQLDTHTLDLSASGVLLPAATGLQQDERVWVAVDIDDDTPFRAHGHVARVTPDGHHGVQFDGLTNNERERLIRFLFTRQRVTVRTKGR